MPAHDTDSSDPSPSDLPLDATPRETITAINELRHQVYVRTRKSHRHGNDINTLTMRADVAERTFDTHRDTMAEALEKINDTLGELKTGQARIEEQVSGVNARLDKLEAARCAGCSQATHTNLQPSTVTVPPSPTLWDRFVAMVQEKAIDWLALFTVVGVAMVIWGGIQQVMAKGWTP